MNLQVDLMLDEERRSGSSVSQKFVLRLAAFVIPVILIGLFVALRVNYHSAKRDRAAIEQEKVRVDPEHKKVIGLEKEFKSARDLKAAIQGWSDSRLDAYRFLRGLQYATPPSIQFTQLGLIEKVEMAGTAFGRITRVSMKGKVAGERPEADVQRLSQALQSEPPFQDIVAQIEVKRFAASAALDDQGGRVFDIELILKPRLLDRPATPGLKSR